MNTLHSRIALPILAATLSLPAFGAKFSMEKCGAPEGVPAAALVAEEGVAVKGSDGAVVARYWGRKGEFEGTPAGGFGIRYDFIPEGALIALVEFTGKGSDFREQGVPAGWYTLRYALHPEDGNHMGVAPSRDFAILSPADKDDQPGTNYKFDEMVELTKKVGNPHPTVARVELPEGDSGPHLWEDDYGHWVLDLPVAGDTVGIVVYGHADE